ncbi:MAG: hypothetical protein NXH85_01985 [Pseudomonadaceae bacterium]|nr:hypothetical protein [Pseudomonadaceae bacterium]
MTDQDDSNELKQTPEDEQLRHRLNAETPAPSAAHDSAILAAAREFSNEADATSEVEQRRSTVETLSTPAPVQAQQTPRWAIAAAVVVSAGIGAMVLLGEPPQIDPTRGNPDDVQPENGAVLSDFPERLKLPAAAQELGCQFVLRDSGGTPTWTSSVTANGHVSLPDEVSKTAGSGDYSWQANCRGVGNQIFGPYRFEITR